MPPGAAVASAADWAPEHHRTYCPGALESALGRVCPRPFQLPVVPWLWQQHCGLHMAALSQVRICPHSPFAQDTSAARLGPLTTSLT